MAPNTTPKPQTPSRVCAAMRRYARASGFKLKEIAKAMDIDPSTLTNYLQDREPELWRIHQFERVLRLPRGQILIDAEEVVIPTSVEDMIAIDRRLSPGWRQILRDSYLAGLRGSAEESGIPANDVPTSDSRRLMSATS